MLGVVSCRCEREPLHGDIGMRTRDLWRLSEVMMAVEMAGCMGGEFKKNGVPFI